MIILPDKNIPRSKFLMPVPKKEWMPKSLSMPKDQFGNEDRTRFKIEAKTNDGCIIWRGWYDDRNDFDAVLWAIAEGTLKYQKELWTLSTPSWDPWLSEIITYSFATTTVLSSSPGTALFYNKPLDWYNDNNSIECIAGGGSGATAVSTTNTTNFATAGGNGGAYGYLPNFNWPRKYSIIYQIAAQATGVSGTAGSASQSNGNQGNNTLWNADPNGLYLLGITTDYLAIGGGVGGNFTDVSVVDCDNGEESSAGGVVQSIYTTGGKGGVVLIGGTGSASGGGGAGGFSGNGKSPLSYSTTNTAGSGASGDNGFGGNGGAPGNPGSAGIELNGGVGSGGGGGGTVGATNANITGGAGGNYGAGGGAANNRGPASGGKASTNATSGAGAQGVIIVTYEPRKRPTMCVG